MFDIFKNIAQNIEHYVCPKIITIALNTNWKDHIVKKTGHRPHLAGGGHGLINGHGHCLGESLSGV